MGKLKHTYPIGIFMLKKLLYRELISTKLQIKFQLQKNKTFSVRLRAYVSKVDVLVMFFYFFRLV
jgi:hypothetical protein